MRQLRFGLALAILAGLAAASFAAPQSQPAGGALTVTYYYLPG
jgi:hypothetical protein